MEITLTPDEMERFWLSVDVGEPDQCWLWQGGMRPNGYGRFYHGRYDSTHRIAWTLVCGPIPDGLQVCHDCDVKACCNWRHHFLGTPKDNHADKARKGRAASGDRNGQRVHPERVARGDRSARRLHPESYLGERNSAAKLTVDQVTAIWKLGKEKELTYPQIGARFEVSRWIVERIMQRQTWAWLTRDWE